jgi:hypothetical protein
MTVTAYAEYHSTEAHKLLADQREHYIAQSAATRNGRVASYPVSPARCLVALPSRQVAGSYPRDDADWCAFVAATSGAIR